MSLWQTIKNAFIPWNLLRSDQTAHEGVRTIDYGQLLIDGANGDISDMARVIERERTPSEHGAEPSAQQPDQPTAPVRRD